MSFVTNVKQKNQSSGSQTRWSSLRQMKTITDAPRHSNKLGKIIFTIIHYEVNNYHVNYGDRKYIPRARAWNKNMSIISLEILNPCWSFSHASINVRS